ncbi:hypothetical protein HHI36_009565, partial [Cryptolaemus montrouzieri]
FRSARIFPFNPNIFDDDDFIASTITDLQKMNEDCLNDVSLKDTTNNNNVVITYNNDDALIDKPSTSTRDKNIISNRKMQILPADIKPFPRVIATKENKMFQRRKIRDSDKHSSFRKS